MRHECNIQVHNNNGKIWKQSESVYKSWKIFTSKVIFLFYSMKSEWMISKNSGNNNK